MSSQLIKFALFIFFAGVYTIVWGKTVSTLVKSKIVVKIAKFLMNYSRMKLDPIRFLIIWLGYLFVSIVGTIVFSVIFKINILDYIHLKNYKEILLYSLIGFIVQLSLSSMILTVISLIKSDINWYSVISNISWVKISSKLPKWIKPLYPISGAFFEELYFRGCIFIIIITEFKFIHPLLAIILISILFSVQQVLNTETVYQAVSMSVGAVCISAVGCMLILATNSFIPALLCHELYVLFYIKH
ncbi:type II CAAX prenyl endopeptidase Rce1 family protein [Clostridium polynesiense]|uniref:CPBP family glutamic-type intramembrane protease n=1 Tax=Clostridium polynesiense TaxID=1325933 RepID=UPI00058BFB32|nr:CPBP family glutamic-type intramembrane protease [Clostridium polynesiense]